MTPPTFSQALLFLLPASIILALEKVTFFGLPVYFLEALFLIFLILVLGNPLLVTRESLQIRWKSLDRWVALGASLLVLGAAVSTLTNEASLTSLSQLKSWFFFPLALAVVLYSLKEGKEEEREPLYYSWFIGVVIVAFISLYGYSSGILTYDERLAFPYSSANFLAILVAPGILLAIFFLYRTRAWSKKWLSFFLIGSFLAVLYLTHSYNTWLALILGTLGVALMFWAPTVRTKNLPRLALLVMGIILLVGTLFFLEQGSSKWQNLLLENGRSSLDSRVMIWQSAGSILQDHWFLGIGVGNFQTVYLSYQSHFSPYLEWAVPQPHNFLLAIWLQTGLIGLLGFVFMSGKLMSLLILKLYRGIQKKNRTEGLLLLGLWIVFFSYGLFDTPYFRNDLAFLFWFQALLTYWYVEEKE